METPILLGANPKTANPSWIPIRFDRWFVRAEGLVDSLLILRSNKMEDFPLTFTFNGTTFNGPCQVKIEFSRRGAEKAVSVFVVERNGV